MNDDDVAVARRVDVELDVARAHAERQVERRKRVFGRVRRRAAMRDRHEALVGHGSSPLPYASSGISRTPMVFDIRCIFRGWTEPELDGYEALLFVEPSRGVVFLVCV